MGVRRFGPLQLLYYYEAEMGRVDMNVDALVSLCFDVRPAAIAQLDFIEAELAIAIGRCV